MINIGDKIKWFNNIYTCIDFRNVFKSKVKEPYAMVKQPYNQPMTHCCDSLEELQEELTLMSKKYGENFKYM